MLKRWFQEGYLSQILGSTSFHGSLVGQLPVAVAVERDNCVLECEPLS